MVNFCIPGVAYEMPVMVKNFLKCPKISCKVNVPVLLYGVKYFLLNFLKSGMWLCECDFVVGYWWHWWNEWHLAVETLLMKKMKKKSVLVLHHSNTSMIIQRVYHDHGILWMWVFGMKVLSGSHGNGWYWWMALLMKKWERNMCWCCIRERIYNGCMVFVSGSGFYHGE